MADNRDALRMDLAALERFIVDNDDLLDLEARIGRFNIFDALRIDRAEIRHSNFLAWLLDPAGSHSLGSLFLKAIMMDVMRRAGELGLPRALSPVELDGVDLQGVEVRREWRGIDLLIACREPEFVVAIENKVESGEHGNQLERYDKVVCADWPDARKQFVFLTRAGDDASDENWVPYGYGDVYRVLRRCRDANAGSIGDDVRVFLDHYLNLIGSRFMNDPTIDELCQRIYRNHRQALQLIWEHAGTPTSAILDELRTRVLERDDQWHVLNRTPRRLDFVPADWLDWIPPICSLPKQDPRFWIRWWIFVGDIRVRLAIEIGPTTEPELRRRVVERLFQDPKEFGFGRPRKFTDMWTRLFTEWIVHWEEDAEPDPDEVVDVVSKELNALQKRVAGVPEVLRPILSEWNAAT